MNEPPVTIVSPSHNQGKFIRVTIESMLAQDYIPPSNTSSWMVAQPMRLPQLWVNMLEDSPLSLKRIATSHTPSIEDFEWRALSGWLGWPPASLMLPAGGSSVRSCGNLPRGISELGGQVIEGYRRCRKGLLARCV